MDFKTIDELKERVTPALRIRVKELKKQNLNFNVDTLFIYFVRIWKNEHNLTLSDIVDDILNREVTELG
jgi:hypothetical protein